MVVGSCLEKSVCCTSLNENVNSRRGKCEPMLVVRGGMNGGRDPAMVVTTVADQMNMGTGLPARCFMGARNKLRTPSVILLRRVQAVSGGQLSSCVNRLDSARVMGVGGTVYVDLNVSGGSGSGCWLLVGLSVVRAGGVTWLASFGGWSEVDIGRMVVGDVGRGCHRVCVSDSIGFCAVSRLASVLN